MSTALILSLIDKQDNSEIVRDKIADVLLTESAEQQILAAAAMPAQSADLYKLRVFTEAENPWEDFRAAHVPGTTTAVVIPIVNIWIDSITYDMHASDIKHRQKATVTYNIDCYGYGCARDGAGNTHTPGDKAAAIEVQRVVKLVRNMLMSSQYIFLGLPRGTSQFVWRRWIQNVQMFQPQFDSRDAIHVAAARMSFSVEMNEFAPEYIPQTLEEIVINVGRAGTGEMFLTAQYGESSP